MKKKYYIKERHNPQLGVYYVPMGQISQAEAKRNEKPLYGDNYMRSYDNEEEYRKAIAKLEADGNRILQQP